MSARAPFWREPQGEWSERCDVVVVGSGAGGAFAAVTLAEAGLEVVLLEEGFRWGHEEFGAGFVPAVERMYQEGGTRLTASSPAFPVVGGKALGGSTVVNSAICFRTPRSVLEQWNEQTGGSIGDLEAWAALQDQVEAVLGVRDTPDAILSGYDWAQKNAARRLGWKEHNFRRNTPWCAGCGRCNTGCPTGAKNSVDRALLPRLAPVGGRVITGARVDRVARHRVEGEVVGRDGLARGRFDVSCDRVVVAAGPIATPTLLLASGLAQEGGPVGAGLQVHPILSCLGLLPEPVARPGSTQGHAVHEFEDDELLLEANPIIPGALFTSLPLHGRQGAELLAQGARFASTGCMIRDRGEGRVLLRRGGGARIEYTPSDEDRLRLIRALHRASEMWFEGADAERVGFTVMSAPLCRSMEEVRRALPEDLPVDRLALYSSHPQASCRLGAALGEDGGLIGVPGVHVMDASALPTAVGRNPQITVMTLARLLAERVAVGLGRTAAPLVPAAALSGVP